MKSKSLIFVAAVLFTASFAGATIIEVGTGSNTANVEFEWKDGFAAEFAVSFDTPSITGWEVFDVITTESTLTTVVENFGWGDFIDGISFAGHSDIGFGGDADWWHFWIKDAGTEEWVSPAYGTSDRVLLPGDSDGWRYGSDFAPGVVPEPATMALLAVGGLLIRRKKS